MFPEAINSSEGQKPLRVDLPCVSARKKKKPQKKFQTNSSKVL